MELHHGRFIPNSFHLYLTNSEDMSDVEKSVVRHGAFHAACDDMRCKHVFDRCGAGHGLCRRWGPASADPTDSTSGEGLFGRSHCEATAGRLKQLTAAVFEQTGGHDLGCSNMVNLETVQANSVFFRVVVFLGEVKLLSSRIFVVPTKQVGNIDLKDTTAATVCGGG